MTTMTTEQPFRPDYAVPPGLTIAELLEEQGMTQTALAGRLGVSLKHVNQIVNAAASISAELALGLEKVLGVPAAFWIHRESLYRADLARHDEERALEEAQAWARRFPLSELKKRGFLASDAAGTELVRQLLGFLGLASPDLWTEPSVVYRKSQVHESDPYALDAWLRAGELAGASIDCSPYDERRFLRALVEIRSLTPHSPRQWQPRLRELCAAAGVAVVVVDTFKGARANGATRWLSPSKALIQLSIRYRWEDIFWFSFFHEACHVVRHRKKLMFVDGPRPADDPNDPELTQLEEEADRFAAQLLIPPEYTDELAALSVAQIPAFSKRLGIAPAIVVGRLHHDGLLPYSHGLGLRRKFEFAG